MKPFVINGDKAGSKNSYAIEFPAYTNVYVLAANTAQTITFPANALYVLFSANGDFYVNANGIASIPSSNVTDGSGSELNPTVRYIDQVSSVSVIAPGATTLTCNFYL